MTKFRTVARLLLRKARVAASLVGAGMRPPAGADPIGRGPGSRSR